jgi:hypothetical protein
LSFKSLIDKLKRLVGGSEKPAPTEPASTPTRATKRQPEKREIVGPEEQMALDRKDIAFNLETIEKGKALLGSQRSQVSRARAPHDRCDPAHRSKRAGFPRERITTPHQWKWDNRDLSHIAPTAES